MFDSIIRPLFSTEIILVPVCVHSVRRLSRGLLAAVPGCQDSLIAGGRREDIPKKETRKREKKTSGPEGNYDRLSFSRLTEKVGLNGRCRLFRVYLPASFHSFLCFRFIYPFFFIQRSSSFLFLFAGFSRLTEGRASKAWFDPDPQNVQKSWNWD